MENDWLVGQQLGAYQIQSKLGEGGMALVYKAYHARLRRDVALKIILPEVADQEGFRERFEREAQVVANLGHPHIVTVYDFGEQLLPGNRVLTYLVMQYVGGGTLRDLMRGQRPIAIRQAIIYARDMALALHLAHQRGIVHRDVKPQNMLISTNERKDILLSDFGIAKLFAQHIHEETFATLTANNAPNNPQLTSVGQMVGTAEYMAPEQINQKQVDARTDVYALGVVLFQMLTGQVPFQSSTLMGLLFQHVHTPAPYVRDLNPNVPESLAQITAKALAKAPESRFQSAEEIAQALEALIPPNDAELRASFLGNYPPNGSFSTEAMSPSFARSSFPPGPAYQSNPSTYNPQSTYVAQSAYGLPATGGAALPTTIAGASTHGVPSRTHPKKAFSLSYLVLALLVVAAIVGGLAWQGHLPWQTTSGGPPPASQNAAAFTENFTSNNRNWPSGSTSAGGPTTLVDSAASKYTISVPGPNTYFLTPNSVGTLPQNFTLTTTIRQDSGATDVPYGLAFRLRENSGGSQVYCYAFVINDSGTYQILKYDPGQPNLYTQMGGGQNLRAIHAHSANTLQVHVQGGTFHFAINAIPIQAGPGAGDQSVTDLSYTGGQLALLVAGPNAGFTATSVALAIP